MAPKPPNKGGEDNDSHEKPTGGSQESLAGRDRSRFEYEVEIGPDVGPEALGLPTAREVIRRLILTGTRESLQEAFRIHPGTAVSVIVEVAESSDPQCVAIAPSLESILVSLLKEHTQAFKERAPAGSPQHEREAFVPFQLAHAVARITRDPQARSEALDIVLSEGAALGYKGHQEVLYVLEYFEPSELMPKLIRFMQGVCGQKAPVRRVFFNGINSLIDHWSRSDNKPADVEHSRERFLSLFATLFGDLLTAEQLEEEVRKQLVAIVETRAKTPGWGLALFVAKLSEACGVAPWCLYVSIVLYSDLSENRVAAAQYLGEHGPTSTLRPLPADVKKVRETLYLVAELAGPELREVARAALARNRERGEEAAKLASSPNLPISTSLTIFPDLGDTSPVVPIDAPGAAAGPGSKALSPDLNLDLARSTLPVSMRPGEIILTHLEGMQKGLTELHAPVVEELRSALQGLHELKSLGSYTDNARAAATVYRLAKSCEMDLTYDGERVALSCRDRKDCKAGVFRLRTLSEEQKSLYERRDFPPLDLTPSQDIVIAEEVDLARSTLPVSRRPGETILTHLEGMQQRLTELHASVGEELRSELQGLHELKSLGSYTDNARAVATVYRLAKSCEMDLTYDGERVALSCRDRKDCKAGVFRLRTSSEKQKFLYERRDFPPLDLAPRTTSTNDPPGL